MKLSGRFYTMTHGAEFLLNTRDSDVVRVLIYMICSMEYDKEFLRINEMYKNALMRDLELDAERLNDILSVVLKEAFAQQYRYVEIPDDRPYARRRYNIEKVEGSFILKPDYFWQGTLGGYKTAYAPRRSYYDKSPFLENESIRRDLRERQEKERKAREAAERKAARGAAKEKEIK